MFPSEGAAAPPIAPTRPEPVRPPPPAGAAADPGPAGPLREWSSAIQRRDERACSRRSPLFLSREGEYREPLLKMAKEDSTPGSARSASPCWDGQVAGRRRRRSSSGWTTRTSTRDERAAGACAAGGRAPA
jgi:hypothetical protein